MREANPTIEEMRRDPRSAGVAHFISRRAYQTKSDTKSSKRREIFTRLSWQSACALGLRRTLGEWERLRAVGQLRDRVASVGLDRLKVRFIHNTAEIDVVAEVPGSDHLAFVGLKLLLVRFVNDAVAIHIGG